MRSRALAARFEFHSLAAAPPGEDLEVFEQRPSYAGGTAHLVGDQVVDVEAPAGMGILEHAIHHHPDDPPIALGDAHFAAVAKDREHFRLVIRGHVRAQLAMDGFRSRQQPARNHLPVQSSHLDDPHRFICHGGLTGTPGPVIESVYPAEASRAGCNNPSRRNISLMPRTAWRMRASFSMSANRTWSSPYSPKPTPGDTATLASASSFRERERTCRLVRVRNLGPDVHGRLRHFHQPAGLVK